MLAATLLACSAGWTQAGEPVYGKVANIQSAEVIECSGIVRSRVHEGIYWVHNDSGDSARLFAIRLDGTVVSTYRVAGAGAIDWEDIAADKDGNLYIADIGNNALNRQDLCIYVVPEPETLSPTGTLHVERKIDVAYPSGDYDCEALFVTPEGELMLMTKYPLPAKVFRHTGADWEETQTLNVPGRAAGGSGLVTGADIHDDGTLAVLTYTGFILYLRDGDGQWVQTKRVAAEPSLMKKCEAICWDGDSLLTANEVDAELFRFEPASFGEVTELTEMPAWIDPAPKSTDVRADRANR